MDSDGAIMFLGFLKIILLLNRCGQNIQNRWQETLKLLKNLFTTRLPDRKFVCTELYSPLNGIAHNQNVTTMYTFA